MEISELFIPEILKVVKEIFGRLSRITTVREITNGFRKALDERNHTNGKLGYFKSYRPNQYDSAVLLPVRILTRGLRTLVQCPSRSGIRTHETHETRGSGTFNSSILKETFQFFRVC